ncbi:MAG: hypothetical protein GXN96_04370 [Aquificae bacterium]|nr:hypothetical protein [Aquificota bacterium]
MFVFLLIPLMFIAILQASLFTPVFGTLFLTPSLTFIFVLFSKYLVGEKIVILAFVSGLFLDAITDSWGIFILSDVLFAYFFLLITLLLIFKKGYVEALLVIPLVTFFRKLFLLFLVQLKYSVKLELSLFAYSVLVELVFILFMYMVMRKRIDAEA